MTSPAACQALCAGLSGCTFFSYEFEYQNELGISIHECYLKSDYTSSDVPSGLTIDACHHYTIWEPGPEWDQHYADRDWVGAAGPAACGYFVAESVQSVAVVSVPGLSGSVVVAASPSRYEFAAGYLSFYHASTQAYIGCAEAGIKPEGIVSSGGKVASMNEGSMAIQECGAGQVARGACSAGDDAIVRYGEMYYLDHHGSMTMCDLTPSGSSVTIACATHLPSASTFIGANSATGHPGFMTAQQYRMLDVRLYGPSGDHVEYDIEPEGGAFTEDGRYLLVNLQDNNGYMIFDTAANAYVTMAGYGYKPMTMDASDKDDGVFIQSGWGSAPSTPSFGMYMPDQVASFTHAGVYYFVTANEGDTRDGEDAIGISGDYEGEEIRFKDLTAPTCTNGCDADSSGFGRLLSTTFQPADYAENSCGTNMCQAWQLDRASSSSFECIYWRADYGGRNSIAGGRAHPDCGYADMVAIYVDSMNKTGQSVTTPASGYSPTVRSRNQTISSTVTQAFSFPGWYSGTTGVDATLDGPAACMAKCAADAACDHWSYEFERGYHECFLKASHTDGAHCDLYVTWAQHWSNGDPWGTYWEGYAGPKQCFPSSPTPGRAPFTTERFSANGHGVTAGHASVGGRSFTIFSWDGQPGSRLVQVYDSGSQFETKQAQVSGGLCSGCIGVADASCEDRCPFNSDEAPPKMDDRSDAKGPEPECVTTGVLSDGTRLAFVGLERTGGIMVYDITNPAQSAFQDYLNVRRRACARCAAARSERARAEARRDGVL